jgi:hypothetical protein
VKHETEETQTEIDRAERAAIAIELGGVPAAYADDFARIQASPPADVPAERRE